MKINAILIAGLLLLFAAAPQASAQRRVFTNEDIPSAPAAPAPAPAPAEAAPTASAAVQPVSDSSPAAAAAPTTAEATPQDENAARRAAALALIRRMNEIRAAIDEASDIFYDKVREGTASEPTINKWNQVRDNLVLASDEMNLFIAEATRNLPAVETPAPPAGAN